MSRSDSPPASAPATLEHSRALASRYETSVMRLGCLTTAVWCTLGWFVFFRLLELASAAGLHWTLGWLVGGVGVLGCRELTLAGYRRVRDRLRRRRLAQLSTGAKAGDLGHLPTPVAALVTELRQLVPMLQAPPGAAEVAIESLRRWLEQLDGLEPRHQVRMSERGLDASILRAIAELRRQPGELTDIWNERAYRRLQAAVPVLLHFERQLASHRDDAYR
ncbi:MAG: hypothetical protein AB1Z98_01810 [Nannocystaceae bacterium]